LDGFTVGAVAVLQVLLTPLLIFFLFLRYPPSIVSLASGGLPPSVEGIMPSTVPITHSLPPAAYPPHAPSPGKTGKAEPDREQHPNEQL